MSRWRLSDWTLGLLTALTIMAIWETVMVNDWPATHGMGGDFPQYYVAGTLVRTGQVARLYDQPYFRSLQVAMRDEPLRSLYPPTLALLVAPLSHFSYRTALAVWWAIQAVCILAAGAIFYCTTPQPRPWRINMLVALTALAPLWLAVGIAQVSPMILLVVAGGLTLHRREHRGWAGVLLALLALKPQMAVGLVLWMLLRRDLRTLAGLAAGFAIQFFAVATLLGPGVWLDYFHAMPAISAVTRSAHFSPLMEASLTGMASNLLFAAGLPAWETPAMKLTYAVTVSAAAIMLCRVVWMRQPLSPAKRPAPPRETENYEYACGVLFMMLVPPYFIAYDQTLMAVPLVLLWPTPSWRWGVALFAVLTVPMLNLCADAWFQPRRPHNPRRVVLPGPCRLHRRVPPAASQRCRLGRLEKIRIS